MGDTGVVTISDAQCLRMLGELFGTPGHPDPYPLYRELRLAAPVHETPLGAVAVSWDACDAILRDRRFSSEGALAAGGLESDDDPGYRKRWTGRWLIYRDPPDHTAIRALFSRVFTPRRVEGLRSYVQQLLASYLEGSIDRGGIELIGEVALPLPITVVGELIGIPASDRSQFRIWSQAIFAPVGNQIAPPELIEAAELASIDVENYIRALADERRQAPCDDLISALISDSDARVSEGDLLANLQFLMSAGFETTVFTIGNSVKALVDNQDQLNYLRTHPEMVKSATEELLRFDTPVIFPNGRWATSDVDVAGTTIKAGTSVAVLPGAANRDPSQFDNPERLDLRREDVHSLSFGSGIHFCLGAALARIEIQEALRALLRFHNIEIIEEVQWTPSVVFRGPQSLKLSVS